MAEARTVIWRGYAPRADGGIELSFLDEKGAISRLLLASPCADALGKVFEHYRLTSSHSPRSSGSPISKDRALFLSHPAKRDEPALRPDPSSVQREDTS